MRILKYSLEELLRRARLIWSNFIEDTAPDAPDSGDVRLYAKTDGRLYTKDSAGNERLLGTSDFGGAHTDLTGVSANQHHNEIHTHASHTGIGANDHHNQAHDIDGPDHTGGTMTAYTPTWTASSTNPNIGNGTLSGKYMQLGKAVFYVFYLKAGSTTTFGSGYWKFSLPVTAAASGQTNGTGTVSCWDSTPGGSTGGGTPYCLTTTELVVDLITIRANLDHDSPFTWASGDQMYGFMWYEGV